jgi:lysylphosphatidylglycerol synthetase-like protein (DUF2156 family)
MTAQQPESRIRYRREVRRHIWIPFAAGVGALALAAGVVMLFPPSNRLGVSLVADWLVTVILLCPLVICTFPLTVGLLALVFQMNRLHARAAQPLRRAETWSRSAADRTAQITEMINQRALNIGVFDRPTTEDKHHEQQQPGSK